MISAVIIFLLPTKNKTRRLLNWEEAVKLPWGILLLFGGGMALAAGFKDSGLALMDWYTNDFVRWCFSFSISFHFNSIC